MAQVFIAQQGINIYNKDIPVMDLIASAQDNILIPLGITLPKILAAYKAVNNLQGGIPTPTVNFNIQNELNHINSIPPLATEAQPATFTHLATGNNYVNCPENQDNKKRT